MVKQRSVRRNRSAMTATLVLGAVFQFGFVETCNDRLISLTTYFDPCGTILANCSPGDFEAGAAAVGDYCVDPACTVPGQCGFGQPLGTITDVCP